MFVYIDKMIIHCPDNHQSVQKRDRPAGGVGTRRELEDPESVCVWMGDEKKAINVSINNGAQVM